MQQDHASVRQGVTELKLLLGLLTCYSKFLPNLSTVLAPLYQLLKVTGRWQWTSRQAQAFEDSKKLLLDSQLLVHFDLSLEIRLACDASTYGIGAVMSHKMSYRPEKPIGFVSHTLTTTENNYSQMEKEGLFLRIWGEEIPLLPGWSSFCVAV